MTPFHDPIPINCALNILRSMLCAVSIQVPIINYSANKKMARWLDNFLAGISNNSEPNASCMVIVTPDYYAALGLEWTDSPTEIAQTIANKISRTRSKSVREIEALSVLTNPVEFKDYLRDLSVIQSIKKNMDLDSKRDLCSVWQNSTGENIVVNPKLFCPAYVTLKSFLMAFPDPSILYSFSSLEAHKPVEKNSTLQHEEQTGTNKKRPKISLFVPAVKVESEIKVQDDDMTKLPDAIYQHDAGWNVRLLIKGKQITRKNANTKLQEYRALQEQAPTSQKIHFQDMIDYLLRAQEAFGWPSQNTEDSSRKMQII